MSGAGTDLIAGYLAELRAGLWVPAAEAELIVAEAEDHLRETAAVGMTVGMTEAKSVGAKIVACASTGNYLARELGLAILPESAIIRHGGNP